MTIPKDVIKLLETKLENLQYGKASLDVIVRGSKIRYEVKQKTSIHEDTLIKDKKNNGD